MPRTRGIAGVALALLAIAAPSAEAKRADAGSLVAVDRGSALELRQPGRPELTLELVETSPAGVERRVERVGEGIIRVELRAASGTGRVAAGFARSAGERFMGFGERSDEVVRRSGTVRNRVTEGPFQTIERPFMAGFVPLPGFTMRDDATYFPIPWLISTRGYGVLVENDETSVHRLGPSWSVSVEGRALSLLVVAGPTPRAVLRRYSAHVGRQPGAMRAALGPWWQPARGADLSEADYLATLRRAGAAGSIAQTYTHYLPCADQIGREREERDLVAHLRRAGLVVTTYFNPMICTSHPRFSEAAANGWLTRTPLGTPEIYRYTAASVFLVGQIDFTAPGAIGFYRSLVREALGHGHRGWMEDFGEYTPDVSQDSTGRTGSAHHNAYARDYHRGVHEAVGGRPLVRYVRSGWTGSARFSPVVWGGDPTTGWEFDGLESAVKNGLTMGLSGVSRWGSDIGGFFALSEPQTTPELMNRWIQVGFASGVMRTQAEGFDLGEAVSGRRAQITDPEVLPIWSRYAKLRTRLLPYLERAEARYRRSGLPVMRHLSLAYPRDPRAVSREDQWLFGDDLLVAPVLRPGRSERAAYLPRGRWIDLWRSADSQLKRLSRPRTLRGGREVVVPAPAAQLPLFVRNGARIELLSRGGPSWRSAVRAGQKRRSLLAFGGRQVKLSGPRRRYDVQWTASRRPAALLVNGRRAPFRYKGGVVRATVRVRRATLRLR